METKKVREDKHYNNYVYTTSPFASLFFWRSSRLIFLFFLRFCRSLTIHLFCLPQFVDCGSSSLLHVNSLEPNAGGKPIFLTVPPVAKFACQKKIISTDVAATQWAYTQYQSGMSFMLKPRATAEVTTYQTWTYPPIHHAKVAGKNPRLHSALRLLMGLFRTFHLPTMLTNPWSSK